MRFDWEPLKKYGLSILAIFLGLASWFWLQTPSDNLIPITKLSLSASPLPSVNATVTVYVSGRVKFPGVIELKIGSRIIDAIKAAGGMTIRNPNLNLARVLVDGEQISVLKEHAASSVTINGKVNLNTADQTQLETIPGIGPVMAQRILDYRNQNGRFKTLAEVDAISGIGPSLMAEIQKVAVVE